MIPSVWLSNPCSTLYKRLNFLKLYLYLVCTTSAGKYVLYKLFYHRNFKHDGLKAETIIETIILRINTGRTSNILHFGYLHNPRNVLNVTSSEY